MSIEGFKVNGSTVKYNYTALDNKPTIPSKTSDLTNDSGFVNASGAASAAPVQSVNGQTGAVTVSPATDAQVTTAVNTWLAANITQETGYVLDDSLTVTGAAADAKAVGDILNTSEINYTDGYFLTNQGFLESNANYSVSDYIPVKASVSTTVTVGSHSNDFVYLVVYDKDKNRKSDWAVAKTDSSRTFTMSASAVYVRFCFQSGFIGKLSQNNVEIYTAGKINLNEKVDTIEETVDELSSDPELYQGEYEQGGWSATEALASSQRIRMKDCIALPYGEDTIIHVEFEVGYLFAVRAGRTAQNLSSNKYWYYSGANVTFTSHEQYYRIIWAKGKNGAYENLTPADISNINPKITYSCAKKATADSNDVYEDAIEKLVNAQNVLSASSHGGIGTMPVIFHASDFHGDYQRVKNALQLAESNKADALVMSGDLVSYAPTDGLGWLHSLFADTSVLPVICTGNHDVNGSSLTDANIYSYMFEPSSAKLGNTNSTTYYYVDIASKKLRIISTDLYQYGGSSRSSAHMSNEQLAYICTALKTAPNDYGIIIVSHSPCVNVSSLADQNYSEFFQPLRKYGFTHYDITGTPIYDIVDAFIGRTTISETYTQTGSPSSISVSDDFSGVSSSVEFIAHMTGHIHEDSVCYLPTTQKQLMLNICCGVAMTGGSSYPYLADDCDMTRLPYGKVQDAINAYVIDRTNKQVKIVRIGGNTTYDMKSREYMAIPYAD